jgi:hypothetical protein
MVQLARLGLEKGKSHEYFGKWEKLLQTFIKQGFLVRKKCGAQNDGQVPYEFVIGPRAELLIGRKNILKHVAEIYNEEVDPIKEKELEQLDSAQGTERPDDDGEDDTRREDNGEGGVHQQSSETQQRRQQQPQENQAEENQQSLPSSSPSQQRAASQRSARRIVTRRSQPRSK